MENFIDKMFYDWLIDGNVIRIDGLFATQDTLYSNRLKADELKDYFIKEFMQA